MIYDLLKDELALIMVFVCTALYRDCQLLSRYCFMFENLATYRAANDKLLSNTSFVSVD